MILYSRDLKQTDGIVGLITCVKQGIYSILFKEISAIRLTKLYNFFITLVSVPYFLKSFKVNDTFTLSFYTIQCYN